MISFDFITDRLATGGRLSGPEDVEELVSVGITHVVDLTFLEADQQYADTGYFANHPLLTLLWNPTEDDGQHKSRHWFAQSVWFSLAALTMPNAAVYCHCDQGLNRGPSTCAAIMMALGWTLDDAIEKIHKARPQTVGYIRYAADAANSLRELGYMS